MKVRGIVTLTKYIEDAEGNLSQTFSTTQENIINKRAIRQFLASGQVFTDARKIATSLQATSPDYEAETLTQINAVGDPTLITDDRVATLRNGVDPTSLVIKNRFNPPASTRTINSIGIVDGATLVDDPGATTVRNSYTYLLLDTPVTQQTVEVLDISYKLFIDWTGSRFGANEQYQLQAEWSWFDFPEDFQNRRGVATHVPITFFPSIYSSEKTGPVANNVTVNHSFIFDKNNTERINPINFSADDIPFGSLENFFGRDEEYGRVVARFGQNAGNPFLFDFYEGFPIRGIMFGAVSAGVSTIAAEADETTTTPLLKDFGAPEYLNDWGGIQLLNKNSNLSNVFSHNETTNVPMYDVNTLANSSLKPIITNTTPTSDFPSEYFLKVVTAGGLGVGEYKLYKTSFSNFPANTRSIENPTPVWELTATYLSENKDDEALIFNPRWIYDWTFSIGNFKFATFEEFKGVVILEVTDSAVNEFAKFPLSTFTQFGTRINDIDVDSGSDIIYVASDTGLYEVTVTGSVVVQLSADACASVTVGNGGEVFAIFRDGLGSGRLSSSIGATWATALDLTGATINWDNVWRIFIDPGSADYDLMIYEGPGSKHSFISGTENAPTTSNLFRIHWWNNVSNFIQTDLYNYTSSASSTTDWYVHEYDIIPTNYAVQVTNGVWIYPTNKFSAFFNTNSGTGNAPYNWYSYEVGTGIPKDMKWAAQEENVGWNTRSSGSIIDNRGWNARVGQGQTLIGPNLRIGNDGEYAFGFHATAPFHTEALPGSISKLVSGKLNAIDTVYDLVFLTDYRIWAQEVSFGSLPASGFRSAGVMFKLSVDEGGVSTLTNYANDDDNYRKVNLSGTFMGPLGMVFHPVGDKQIMWAKDVRRKGIFYDFDETEPVSNFLLELSRDDGGIGWFSPVYNAPDDLNDLWVQAYEWTGAAWIVDEDNTGPGKPAHSSTDLLIDGLSISWNEELPGNPQPLVLDQYYNFVKITEPNTILVESNIPDITGGWEIYYRDCPLINQSGTIPGVAPVRVYINEAPLGSAPDSLWLSLPPDNIGPQWSATINGSPVNIEINASTTPPAGTIYITDVAAGEVYFNAADSSQPYNIQGFYIRKYDTSEIL